jgi:hypothetical protein
MGTGRSWVFLCQNMMAKLTEKVMTIVRMMERGRNFATGAAPWQNRLARVLG